MSIKGSYVGIIVVVLLLTTTSFSGCLDDDNNKVVEKKKDYPDMLEIYQGKTSWGVASWFTFFTAPNLKNITITCDTSRQSERQEYVYWIIYNRTGEQIYEQYPFDGHLSTSVDIPPDPPYLILARCTTKANITIHSSIEIAYAWVIDYVKEFDIKYEIVVDSGEIEGETIFNVGQHVVYPYCHYSREVEEGSSTGNLSTRDPEGRLIYSEEYHADGNENHFYGETAMRGDWKLNLRLDYYSAGRTVWSKIMTFTNIIPEIEELGFDFPYEGY